MIATRTVFPYSKILAVCRVGNNFEKVFFGDIFKNGAVFKKGGWYEIWPSTIFATDIAAAGTTGTAGFLPRLVFVQLSARPELGSKKII